MQEYTQAEERSKKIKKVRKFFAFIFPAVQILIRLFYYRPRPQIPQVQYTNALMRSSKKTNIEANM